MEPYDEAMRQLMLDAIQRMQSVSLEALKTRVAVTQNVANSIATLYAAAVPAMTVMSGAPKPNLISLYPHSSLVFAYAQAMTVMSGARWIA